MLKFRENLHFIWVNCMVYKLYFNKTITKKHCVWYIKMELNMHYCLMFLEAQMTP